VWTVPAEMHWSARMIDPQIPPEPDHD
jgi:hypothetical protein